MRNVAVVLSLALSASAAQAAFPAPARGTRGMAATAHPLATAAAVDVLGAGGNAVDAAVAAVFVISVVEPFSAGIGGGGFAVVHLEGKGGAPPQERALDFRERAPARATKDMYMGTPDAVGKRSVVEGLSLDGHLSVAVPGTVAGMAALHKAHGKLPWKSLLAPAIKAARNGFVVGDAFVNDFAARSAAMLRFASTRAVFMKRDKSGQELPLERGDLLKQPDLARTLESVAQDPALFASGAVGAAIAAEMKRGGGVLDQSDLLAYQPLWRDPLCGDWDGLRLCTMGPPSSGGVHVLEILNLLDGTDLRALGWHHPDALHMLIESMRIAFADRAVHLGDPAFTPVPVAELVSMPYANLRRPEIDRARAHTSSEVSAATPAQLRAARGGPAGPAHKESPDTSHLTVVDSARNAVALTFTVNYGFGSGLVVPGTGVLLNDEMDDFAAAPGVPNSYGLVGGDANAVAPGKIPLSSMTPLIATKDGHFFMTAGAPGGSTIITTTLQTLLHVVVYGMDAQAAVSAPRIHQQWLPNETRVERFGLDEATRTALEKRGHKLNVTPRGWGNAMCIVARPDGTLEGGADPRGEGVARGL